MLHQLFLLLDQLTVLLTRHGVFGNDLHIQVSIRNGFRWLSVFFAMKNTMSHIPRSSLTTAPEVRHIRSPRSLCSGGLGLPASVKNESALGAAYQYSCKTTIPYLPTIYFIEYDSEYLCECYDWDWVQMSNNATPMALLFNEASSCPTEMLRIPMRLRICRPEAGLVSPLKKWTPFIKQFAISSA